ncbi:MAG: UDP-glucose 4-epimerase [Halobacteriales archaeon]|jgi:UDP-glucose 4-epimerase
MRNGGTMHVLVTGGCGYVGSALVPRLQTAGDVDRVTVLDTLENGSLGNLVGAPITDGFEFRQGDVREYADVEAAMAGVDAVIHLAAINRRDSSAAGKAETYAVNLDGTWTVLEAARSNDVETVVYPSSCLVYGHADRPDDAATPTPFDPYTEATVEAERLLEEFAAEPDRTGTVLRLGTAYGYAPGVRFDSPVNRFVFRALTDRPIVIRGDPAGWQPYVHVEDVAGALAHAVRRPHRWSNPVYDVGASVEQYRLADVANVVREEINPGLEVREAEEGAAGVSVRLSFDEFRDTGVTFGWTLAEGVRDLADRFVDADQPTPRR